MISGRIKLRLRLLTIAVNEEFFNVVRKGMNDAAAAMQVEADLAGTPGVDAGELVRLTRQAIADGVDGMNFVAQSVASSKEDGAWKSLRHPLCRT